MVRLSKPVLIILTGILPAVFATAGEFTTFKNDQGIDLFFDYTGEVMSNVSGLSLIHI